MKELSNCLYCQGDLQIKEAECLSCSTKVIGSFTTNRFHMFDKADLFFIEMFLKNEGNIKLMEKDLRISYPTVKSRLKNIIHSLGYAKDADEEKRIQILQDLAEKKITVKDALKNLEKM